MGCYNSCVSRALSESGESFARPSRPVKRAVVGHLGLGDLPKRRGQVAQVVERSPEKAGVGGSTPSLATRF